MQLRSLRTTNKPKLMIIPMIDIIFFLLVFFMMSMLSMVVQKSVPINLPSSQTAKVDIQKKVPITVTADGSIYVEQTKTTIDGMIKYLQIEQGNVTGMIGSFSVLSISDGEPFAITGGVGEALIATATGLCVAIIALVIHTYLTQREDNLVSQMEEIGAVYMTALVGDNNAA